MKKFLKWLKSLFPKKPMAYGDDPGDNPPHKPPNPPPGK